jgi:hypothetical protein
VGNSYVLQKGRVMKQMDQVKAAMCLACGNIGKFKPNKFLPAFTPDLCRQN